jgi:hypothetical protein
MPLRRPLLDVYPKVIGRAALKSVIEDEGVVGDGSAETRRVGKGDDCKLENTSSYICARISEC